MKLVKHLALRAPESALGGTGSVRPFDSSFEFCIYNGRLNNESQHIKTAAKVMEM
jgi:hypothetical protein